jgi:uncharacterized protein (DUF849 family)
VVPTKKMSPHLPVTAKEVIADVLACADLGAAIAHIHARDENGKPSYRKELYERIIVGIREKRSDLVICVSCSGRVEFDLTRRSEVLGLAGDAKPDMASLTLGSLNIGRSASVNSPDTIRALAAAMRERGIKPELEVFDLGMVNYAHYLMRKETLSPPFYFNLILGNVASAQADLLYVGMILKELPEDSIATLAGIGERQIDANIMGLLFADGARVGLEDSLHFDVERKHLATNAQLVERVAHCTTLCGRRIASPAEVRRRLGLAAR